MNASPKLGRTFARISLDAIRHNGAICRKTFPGKKILCVLKADAYGHGITGVMPAYESFADYYAVATVEEGLLVRAQTEKPVLLFGPAPEGQMVLAAENKLTFTVGSKEYAGRLAAKLEEAGLTADCHLKIETGLNRSGVRWRDPAAAMEPIRAIHAHKCLRFTGTYTHFACGEGQLPWELEFTALQYSRLTQAIAAMEAEGLPTGLRHCCSTGGSLVHPEYQLDMVRLGMMPMGMSYSDESVKELGLIPAMKWVSYISQIEDLPAGDTVSYGCLFRADKPMRIGMLTCGYADGYRRAYTGNTHVLIGGKQVRTIGRIAMDCMMVDLTDVDAKVGDEAILLGTDGVNTISAQELMRYGESVSGEVTAAISPRVKRVYE